MTVTLTMTEKERSIIAFALSHYAQALRLTLTRGLPIKDCVKTIGFIERLFVRVCNAEQRCDEDADRRDADEERYRRKRDRERAEVYDRNHAPDYPAEQAKAIGEDR